MARVYLSLGSNIDPERHIQACLERLAEDFGELDVSPIYRCPAVGFDGDDFHNLAVALDTALIPEALLERLKDIEDDLGRRRDGPRFSDRSIDIDLLLFDDCIGRYRGKEIPRPEILEQAFVLKPLADIAGEVLHPVLQRPLAALWSDMAVHGDELVPVAGAD